MSTIKNVGGKPAQDSIQGNHVYDRAEIIRICAKSSFNNTDLVSMRNLFMRYINNKALICLSCPSSLRHYIKVFQENKQMMLSKIPDESQN